MIGLWTLLAAFAQPVEPDRVELWSEAKLNVDLPRRVEIEVAQHFRVTPAPLRVWELLTDIGVAKGLTKWLDVGAGFRAGGRDFVPGRLEPRLRAHADLKASAKVQAFRVSLRERYQYRLPTPAQGDRHTVRSKLQLGLDVSKVVRVYVAGEPYLRLGEATPFDRVRLESGVRLDLPERVVLDFWGRLEEPFVADDARTWVAGVSVRKTVKPKKRKKDDEGDTDDTPADGLPELLPEG